MADPEIVVLGIAQDGGHPQAGCDGPCCAAAWANPTLGHRVACLGVFDPDTGERWLIDATPDLPRQLRALNEAIGAPGPLTGVALTHAHTGHYAGLIWLGREAMAARALPLYAMPRMRGFLTDHGPWEFLLRQGHARLAPLAPNQPIALNARIGLTPIPVPHRGEYSETVALRIDGPSRSALYAPDVDRWIGPSPESPTAFSIERAIAGVDRAWLDGTFYSDAELPGRDRSDIPHPPIAETCRRLAGLPERERVRFIHLNHTNPCLDPGSPESAAVRAAGMGVAQEGERFAI